MSSPEVQTRDTPQSIADRVAARVSSALKKEKDVVPDPRGLSAIVGAVIEGFATLPAERRRELSEHPDEFSQRIRHLVEDLAYEDSDRIHLDSPEEVETSQGEGLGPILAPGARQRGLAGIAVHRRIEDWAGKVAGATELSRKYGIARSSLNRWQRSGDVIGLLKGTRKRIYPVEQFVDGRPVRGIREILRLVDSERVAWLWLSQRNPLLKGARPIDLLRQDRKHEVLDVAEAYFAAA